MAIRKKVFWFKKQVEQSFYVMQLQVATPVKSGLLQQYHPIRIHHRFQILPYFCLYFYFCLSLSLSLSLSLHCSLAFLALSPSLSLPLFSLSLSLDVCLLAQGFWSTLVFGFKFVGYPQYTSERYGRACLSYSDYIFYLLCG